MTIKKNSVIKLTKDDVPEVVDTLCDAFADYPVMRFVLFSEINYKENLKTLIHFFVMARVLRGETMYGVGNRADLDGVAVTSNPENTADIEELNNLRDQVWQKLGDRARFRYKKFTDIWSKFKIEAAHIHLNMIGIRQRAQRQGLARPLMDRVHQLSLNNPNSDGVTLTTEVRDNVSFYEYMGYSQTGYNIVAPDVYTWSFFRPD